MIVEDSKEEKENAPKKGNNKRRNRGRGRSKVREKKEEGAGKPDGEKNKEEAVEKANDGEAKANEGEKKAKKRNNRGRSKKAVDKSTGSKENGENGTTEEKKKQPAKRFDDGFSDAVKAQIKKKVEVRSPICMISIGDARVKLGPEGYCAILHSSGIVGEGTFVCDESGVVTLTWRNILTCEDNAWTPSDPISTAGNGKVIASFRWDDENIDSVTREETSEALWGADKPDPKSLFEKNNFQMRKLFLDRGAPRNNRRRNNRKGGKSETREEAKK